MDIHRASLDYSVVSPDSLQQALTRHDSISVFDEVLQKFKFTTREAYRFAIHGHRHSVKIRRQVRAAIDGRPLWLALGLRSAAAQITSRLFRPVF